MENPNDTIDQLVSEVAALRAEMNELRAGLDYAVYGIGVSHPDPRDQGEAVPE